jgi:hypothetical protein
MLRTMERAIRKFGRVGQRDINRQYRQMRGESLASLVGSGMATSSRMGLAGRQARRFRRDARLQLGERKAGLMFELAKAQGTPPQYNPTQLMPAVASLYGQQIGVDASRRGTGGQILGMLGGIGGAAIGSAIGGGWNPLGSAGAQTGGGGGGFGGGWGGWGGGGWQSPLPPNLKL